MYHYEYEYLSNMLQCRRIDCSGYNARHRQVGLDVGMETPFSVPRNLFHSLHPHFAFHVSIISTPK